MPSPRSGIHRANGTPLPTRSFLGSTFASKGPAASALFRGGSALCLGDAVKTYREFMYHYRAARKYILTGLFGICVSHTLHGKSVGWNADELAAELASLHKIPAAPEGVTDLRFAEFFISPVGPRGLQATEKLNRLNGRRVRIIGFMVEQARQIPGVLMLAPFALATHEGEYGLCDDLPPATVFVTAPKYRDSAVPFTPGPLALTGTLDLGAREEADGRVSHVRLLLDSESESALKKAKPNG